MGDLDFVSCVTKGDLHLPVPEETVQYVFKLSYHA